jgi:hypothetical protein
MAEGILGRPLADRTRSSRCYYAEISVKSTLQTKVQLSHRVPTLQKERADRSDSGD